MGAAWSFSLSRIDDIEALGSRWRSLQLRAQTSFFQSWDWVGSWLQALPDDVDPYVLEIRRKTSLVGVAVLGYRLIRRHKVFWSRALRVTESGRRDLDTLTMEHNGFLMEKGSEAEVLRHGLSRLTHQSIPWDELYVSGVDSANVGEYRVAAWTSGLRAVVSAEAPYFYVDLDEMRRRGNDLMAALSRNARYQVRRSIREYEKVGPLTLRAANSIDEARRFFAEMKLLHQARWNARGEPGAFSTDFANEFHRRLIDVGFSHGSVQLLEISAGSKRLGYLYNFVHDGVVSNYQSGFEPENDPKLKWGLVSHCQAIKYALHRGMRTYDFLMGNQRYKRTLATNKAYMSWLVLQRQRARFRVEAQLKSVWRRIRERLRDK